MRQARLHVVQAYQNGDICVVSVDVASPNWSEPHLRGPLLVSRGVGVTAAHGLLEAAPEFLAQQLDVVAERPQVRRGQGFAPVLVAIVEDDPHPAIAQNLTGERRWRGGKR